MSNLVRRAAQSVGVDRKLRELRIANAKPVTVDGIPLPPASIRLGGRHFLSDRDFLDAAVRDARRLHDNLGVTSTSRVLDIGCGVGRLPIGLRSYLGTIPRYTGVDVNRGVIRWCKKHISGPSVAFVHLDLANERYNPGGTAVDERLQLPLPDAAWDAIHLYSVFSHMETHDVVAYLREFRRLLAPGGGVFLTAFVEEGVEDIAINPAGYGTFEGEWSGALHCVRFDRDFFARYVHNAGLRIARFDHQTDTDGQSAIYLELG